MALKLSGVRRSFFAFDIRERMEEDAEAGYEDLAEDEDSAESSYVSEGQRGYVSVDNEDD